MPKRKPSARRKAKPTKGQANAGSASRPRKQAQMEWLFPGRVRVRVRAEVRQRTLFEWVSEQDAGNLKRWLGGG